MKKLITTFLLLTFALWGTLDGFAAEGNQVPEESRGNSVKKAELVGKIQPEQPVEKTVPEESSVVIPQKANITESCKITACTNCGTKKDSEEVESYKNYYDNLIGFAGGDFGWKTYSGCFGARFELMLPAYVSLVGGGGEGTWGWVLSGGVRLNIPLIKRDGSIFRFYLSPGIGYTYNFGGIGKVESEVDTIHGTTREEYVEVELKPVEVINFTTALTWQFTRVKFFVELGYGYALQKDNYEVSEGIKLSKKAQDRVNDYHPGGITFGMGVGCGF